MPASTQILGVFWPSWRGPGISAAKAALGAAPGTSAAAPAACRMSLRETFSAIENPPFQEHAIISPQPYAILVFRRFVPLSSATYFVFLTAIFFLYWPVARVRTLGLAVLLFANYFFYARWGIAYLFLIPLASTVDFVIGLGLQRFNNGLVRRLLVAASLAVNLGLLVSLKFQLGPARNWVLPLALSFYAFQALTYTLDLYRRDGKGTTSYLAH